MSTTRLTAGKWMNALSMGAYMITFKKVDGSTRSMLCTLNPAHIPMDQLPEDYRDGETAKYTGAVRVFDLEKQEWRSFKPESVISWEHWDKP